MQVKLVGSCKYFDSGRYEILSGFVVADYNPKARAKAIVQTSFSVIKIESLGLFRKTSERFAATAA